jgi:hypothetical protein
MMFTRDAIVCEQESGWTTADLSEDWVNNRLEEKPWTSR